MRLIDADALELALKIKAPISDSMRVMWAECLQEVRFAPTIEPERKKGKWIKAQGMMPPEMFGVYYCSVCDGKAMRDYKSHKQILTDWCPHCGAMMEEGDE